MIDLRLLLGDSSLFLKEQKMEVRKDLVAETDVLVA